MHANVAVNAASRNDFSTLLIAGEIGHGTGVPFKAANNTTRGNVKVRNISHRVGKDNFTKREYVN